MLTDEQWTALEPLVERCRPPAKTPPRHLRRTVGAIVWRHRNGATWRAIPAELGPWWKAAQTFIRWARLGVWGRLLRLAQERGVALGMVSLDGTAIHAHQKAAGAARTGGEAAERDRREALGRSRGGYGTKACVIADGGGRAVAFLLAPGQAQRRPSRAGYLLCCPERRCGSSPTAATRATPSASTSGISAPTRPSSRNGARRRSPARSGSTITATSSSALGAAEGVACRRNPLREDRHLLPRRPQPGSDPRLAQALTGPNRPETRIVPRLLPSRLGDDGRERGWRCRDCGPRPRRGRRGRSRARAAAAPSAPPRGCPRPARPAPRRLARPGPAA
jgi:transposase